MRDESGRPTPAVDGRDARPPPARRVRDRDVVVLAAGVAAVVLWLQLLSALVPAVADTLGLAPVLIGALIIVTLVVLARALRPPATPG
jgi:hypothetical protein